MADASVEKNANTNLFADDDDNALDLKEILALLLAGWPILLATTLVGVIAALYVAFTSPPVYETDALVQVEQKTNEAQVALANMQTAVGSGPRIPAEVQILKSRLVLGQVVKANGLDIQSSPSFFPYVGQAFWRRHADERFGNAPWFLAPFDSESDAWGGEMIRVSTLDVPPELENHSFRITATQNGGFTLGTGEETLAAGQVGELLATTWRNQPISLFVRQLEAPPGVSFSVKKLSPQIAISRLQRRIRIEPSESTGMITLKLTGQNPQEIVDTLETLLAIYQQQNIDRRSADSEKTLAFLREQLPKVKREVETAESKLNQFKVEQGTADLQQDTQNVLMLSVELERKRAELRQQRDAALEQYTSNHPVVESLNFQIRQVNQSLNEVDEEVRTLPDLQQRALELQRDVEVSTSLFVSLLNRVQEMEVVKSGTIGNIRIIDSPLVPLGPSGPDNAQTLVLFSVAGAMFGMLILLGIYFLRSGISDPAIIESKLGLPTYGSIPYSQVQARLESRFKNKQLDRQFLAQSEPAGPTMEAIRSVRTALHFARMDAGNNIVMLTGPEPQVGKSFVSVNLAGTLALAGESVIVVDADLRRGHINKAFNLPRDGGLSDVIAGRMALDEAIHTTDLENFSVLTTGTFPPNPSELLLQDRFEETMQALSKRFDHVIIDSPPVLAVTDAAIIGRLAGVVMLVLKSGTHSLRMIDDTVGRLERANIRVQGTLFNQVGRGRLAQYSYKYGYYYGGYKYEYKPSGQNS